MKSKVEALAASASVPAIALMGRFCCGKEDKEGLVQYWSQDTREDRLSVARDFITDVRTPEKLRKTIFSFLCIRY